MGLIIYHERCLNCAHKKDLSRLYDFAMQHGLTIEKRRVIFSPKWRQEAEISSDIEMPYVWNEANSASVSLTGDLTSLL